VSCDVERQHASADQTIVRLTGEKVVAFAVAKVAVSGNVLIEGIIFAGIDADHRSACGDGADTGKHEHDYGRTG
jgi:hypothetical protein